jgi:serine/threonine protein kinase
MPARVARGQRVGGRYRLERELGRGGGSVTWEATDERLDRAVALRLFEGGIDRKALTKRAGVAASLTHPRVVRVFDTGQEGDQFFTVSELLPASLRTVRLPLSSDEAIRMAIDAAEALSYAHERGVVHGHLHEGNILLSENGAKVGDFALAGHDSETNRATDLEAFGALLRRVTANGTSGPPGFTHVASNLAEGGYENASAALDDLRELRPAPPPPAQASKRRGWLIAVIALLVGVAAFGITRFGERSPQTRFAPGGRIKGTPLRVASVEDYDPLGDGREGHSTVTKIDDKDPQTFWSTERYSGGPNFSGLKDGVGVIFDLGSSADVGKTQVLLAAPGCSFQIRYSDNRGGPVGEWPTAATVTKSPKSAPLIFRAANARYWLLWITQLTNNVPGAGGSSACGVAETDFFAP